MRPPLAPVSSKKRAESELNISVMESNRKDFRSSSVPGAVLITLHSICYYYPWELGDRNVKEFAQTHKASQR